MLSAREGLERLREGNRRFLADVRSHEGLASQARRSELTAGQEPFAIILDGRIISAPTIQGAIPSGDGQITGSFSIQSAAELVTLLNGGALPAPLEVVERRTVSASLGADAVNAGMISTAVGFAIIVLFMFLAYGFLFGGISVIGLLLNGLLIIAAMSMPSMPI